MNLNILICDDDLIFINKINNDIYNYFNNKYDIDINLVSKDFNSIINNKYNIIFIDIDLEDEEYNGITLSKILKDNNEEALIIFMSNRNELIFDTLGVGIFQFIRKDHYDVDCSLVLNQISNYINNLDQFKLININGRLIKIYQSTIKYIISIGNEITIVTKNKEYTYPSTMKKIIEELDFNNLIQIQRTLTINIQYIEEFIKWKVIIENKEYKIGRIYQKKFYKRYKDYLLGDKR